MGIVLYSRREIVLNNAGKVITSSYVSLAIRYRAVRIMEDISAYVGGNKGVDHSTYS